jgi:hypothetical protein
VRDHYRDFVSAFEVSGKGVSLPPWILFAVDKPLIAQEGAGGGIL